MVGVTFQCEVISQGSLSLEAYYKIFASTQKAEPFSVTVEAYEWSYPA